MRGCAMCDDVKLAACHVTSNDKIRNLQCNVFLGKMHLRKMRSNFHKCILLLLEDKKLKNL